MLRAELLPHQLASQGWAMVVVAADGTASTCGAVGFLDQAVILAADHGAQLRISPQVRLQMEAEGCAPDTWPAPRDWPGPLWVRMLAADGRARRDSSGRALSGRRRAG